MGRRPNEGFSMSSFEWMELQTLTNDIELSRSRLVEARKSGDRGRVTALEEEIGRAENRRLQLLAHISTNIVTIPEAASKAKDGAGSRQAQEEVSAETPTSETASAPEPAPPPKAREGAGSRPAFAKADSVEGGTIVWDQLKPSDIERVKNELGTRRAEMLARHAEELKELEAEQSQLETLEQAIEMFLREARRSA